MYISCSCSDSGLRVARRTALPCPALLYIASASCRKVHNIGKPHPPPQLPPSTHNSDPPPPAAVAATSPLCAACTALQTLHYRHSCSAAPQLAADTMQPLHQTNFSARLIERLGVRRPLAVAFILRHPLRKTSRLVQPTKDEDNHKATTTMPGDDGDDSPSVVAGGPRYTPAGRHAAELPFHVFFRERDMTVLERLSHLFTLPPYRHASAQLVMWTPDS